MNLTIKKAAQYLAALTFVLLWLNIGVDLNVNISDSWIDIVNGLRLISPIVCFIFLLILFLMQKCYLKVEFWFLFFGLYFILILLSSFLNSSDSNSIYFPTMSIIAIGTVLLLSQSFDHNHLKVFHILAGISAIMLFLVLLIFTFKTIITGASTGHVIGYNIGSLEKRDFLKLPAPLPTGLARSYCIAFLFTLFLFWAGKCPEYKFRIISGILLGGIIFFQSRGALTAFAFTLLFASVVNWLKFEQLKKTIAQITLSAVLSFAALCIIPLSYFFSTNIIFGVGEATSPFDKLQLIRSVNPEDVSSGRLGHWMNAFNFGLEKFWMGYGSQADRMLIDQSVSSAPMYAFLCGGILALSVLSGTFLRLVLITPSLIKRSKLPETKFCYCVIVFLTLRGGIETGLAVHGIDFLLVTPCLYFLFSEYRKV